MDGSSVLKRTLRRQHSLQEHRAHFDAIIKESIHNVRAELSDIGNIIVKDLAEHQDLAVEMLVTNFAHNLQRSTDRFVHKSVDSVWNQYDTNNDGFLQPSEMRLVVRTLFTTLEFGLPELVQGAMEPALDDLVHWLQSESMGSAGFGKGFSAGHLVMETTSRAQVEAASKTVLVLFGLVLKGLIKSSNAISDELCQELDIDNDGKVSKAEFSEGFAEAISPVLDFSRITKLILQERVLRSSSSTQPGSAAEFLNIGQLILGCAAAAALVGGLLLPLLRTRRHR